jgi:hypothetical protein
MRFAGLVTLILMISGPALGQRANLVRPPRVRALAQAFKNGKLPKPMRLPAGNVDQQAATLAKGVPTV